MEQKDWVIASAMSGILDDGTSTDELTLTFLRYFEELDRNTLPQDNPQELHRNDSDEGGMKRTRDDKSGVSRRQGMLSNEIKPKGWANVSNAARRVAWEPSFAFNFNKVN